MMKQSEDDPQNITVSHNESSMQMEVITEYQHQQQAQQKPQQNMQLPEKRPYSNAERQKRYREKRKAYKKNASVSQFRDIEPPREQLQPDVEINKRQSQSNAERQRKYRKLLCEKQKQQMEHTSTIHRLQKVDQAERARKRHLNKQRQSRFRARQRFELPSSSSHKGQTESETLQFKSQMIFNKKENIFVVQNTSTVQNNENNHSYHMVQNDRVKKKNTDTNIKEEVCYQEGIEDIRVNANQQLHIKSENPQSPIMNEQMECQINNEHLEMKREDPGENTDFDDNQSVSEQDYPQLYDMLQQKVSEENLPNINVKQEVCYEEVNDDIQHNGNGHLQIKSKNTQLPHADVQMDYRTDNIHDEMITNNKIVAKYYTRGFGSENENSKLLLPEIKVFNNILEISPLKCTNLEDDCTTPGTTKPKRAKFKRDIKIKTPAERSRDYRARKKARQMAAKEESNNPAPIQTEIQEERSQSDNSQESDGCVQTTKRRKTPAEYSREYRARKKALKELHKEQRKSENNNLNSQIKPKTPAERSREYRARKKAYTDLEEPIPMEPSIVLVVSNDPCRLYPNHDSILPDLDYNTNIPNAITTDINNTTEESSDARIGLHDILHHVHNYISNKFSKEISTDSDIQKETSKAEVIEDIKINVDEQLQVKTEHTQDSVYEKEESNFLIPGSTVKNVYDHILEIKQETPCEYTNFDDNQSIDRIQNIETNLEESFIIKCEENQSPDSQLAGSSAEMPLLPSTT